MDKIFIPASKPEDWKRLLAEPEKHWKTGYSAKTLAYCWQEADGFPGDVKRVFRNSNIGLFQNAELLLAFPEYRVPLPGGRRPSQSDIFVLAKGNCQLISIAVEGKANETFGQTVSEWTLEKGKGKAERLKYLCNLLKLNECDTNWIGYQLLHRTASGLIEARRFNASNALMLVHSFFHKGRGVDEVDEAFEDYKRFLSLYFLEGLKPDSLVFAKNVDGIDLYFAWVKGNPRFLEK